jgi:hypothetical protein
MMSATAHMAATETPMAMALRQKVSGDIVFSPFWIGRLYGEALVPASGPGVERVQKQPAPLSNVGYA